jgi:1-deoxy-D-xylulose-5-phosphate reductoisomerase
MPAERAPLEPAPRPLRVAILGSTGSVGANTLDVIARHPGRFEVVGLSARQRVPELLEQCRRHRPSVAVVADEATAQRLREGLAAASVPTQVRAGAPALEELAASPAVDAVMAAIVGAAGLPSCLAAARAGKRLMLANKEALVVGGRLFMEAVARGGATLLPVDSEHSAIFQCLPADRSLWPRTIDRLLLTASGGPFRTRDPGTLAHVTPAEAVAHPNWVMGRKISVDSATMMNKALEVIEARWLFDLDPARIEVVIHPQSVVHSMVQCIDGSVLAQLGTPDMRVPIAVALAHPERVESGAARLDFTRMPDWHFEPPDPRRFPALPLAWAALAAREGATTVLNAANEVAVEAFLEGRITFTAIHRINAGTLEALEPRLVPPARVDDLLAVDELARRHAAESMRRLPAQERAA